MVECKKITSSSKLVTRDHYNGSLVSIKTGWCNPLYDLNNQVLFTVRVLLQEPTIGDHDPYMPFYIVYYGI